MIFNNDASWNHSHTDELKKLVLFPGSITEYEQFVGHSVEVVDTGLPNKAFLFDNVGYMPNSLVPLLKRGIEAIVNASITTYSSSNATDLIYGLPVRRKISL